MSQRVWTCTQCGWRSTAENVDRINGSFGRGEAPPHCRRCHGRHLTVASVKHPQVTLVCKNPKCRHDFIGWPGAKYCEACRPVFRGQKIWDGRRKWIWTPERDRILRDEYHSNATEFATRWGWPKWVITHRAQRLGLCRTKEQPWTTAEDAFIIKWAGVHPPQWMQRQLRSRTITAIVVRLKRLQVSRRIHADGLTLQQLEQALGVDHRQLTAWWKSGRLKGRYLENQHEHERYEFQECDVADFLLSNPLSFRLDRVDQPWFMNLMREACATREAHDEATESDVAPPKKRSQKKSRMAITAADLMPCDGVDDDTPCPYQKTVVAKPHIPPRCPDCQLELRRRLRLDTAARQRTRPAFQWDDEPAPGRVSS